MLNININHIGKVILLIRGKPQMLLQYQVLHFNIHTIDMPTIETYLK